MSAGNANKSVDGAPAEGRDEAPDEVEASRPGTETEAAAPAERASAGAEAGARSGISLMTGIVPRLAILVAVVAILIAGSLWWQYRAFYADLDEADQALLENLEDARASLRRLGDTVEGLETGLGESDAEIVRLRDDLEVLPAELRALGRRVEALQGGRLDARDSWLREQAEYYLVLANAELNLSRNVGSAIAALDLADDVLRELADPALTDVRIAVASELQALRSVELPDLEGLAADLGGLIERTPELPMRAAAPERFGASEEDLADVEPGLGRLWARTRGAVTSIVRIERQEEPVAQLLTESERRIVRRQLALELTIARTAVLERREQALRASLDAADDILERDFAREAQGVVEARRLIASMQSMALAPRLPDISDSLTLLRTLPGSE